MSIDKISAIDSLTPLSISRIRQVMRAENISDVQKFRFVERNQAVLQDLSKPLLTGKEYSYLMLSRPLEKFKPIKNSFTKRGDKILLSKALGIPFSEVDDYIAEFEDNISILEDLKFLPEDKYDAIRSYIFRHGSKEDVAAFLEIELGKAKNKIKALETNLVYHQGGMADYFIRPIHRMDNGTFVKLYNVIDKNIQNSFASGEISEADRDKIALWSLQRLYEIKNNSQLINAVKTYKVLSK